MVAISSCPICAKQVSVPQKADPQATVRCPLCDAEFTLQAALDLAPPMLVVIGGGADFGSGFDEPADTLPMHGAQSMAVLGEGDDAALLESPLEESVPSFSEDISFDAPPVEDVDREEIDTELETAKANASFDDLLEAGEMAPTDDFGAEPGFAPAGDDDLMFQPTEGEVGDIDDSNSAAAIAVATRKVRRPKEPSMIGNLIGVVGGGVIGCGMALMIVLWIGGPEYDFAGLGGKLPKWMLPPSFSKPKVAASTPLSNNPTPADLAEVKKAAQDGGLGRIKVNVPTLPDKPAATEPPADATAETEAAPADATSTPEDPSALANDLATDSTPATPDAAVTEAEPAAEEPPAEEAPAEEAPAEEVPAESTPAKEAAPGEVEATSATEVAETIGPKQPAAYTADDLKTALDEAQQLAGQLAAADPTDAAATKKIKKDYYRKLFRLGEVSTFAKGEEGTEKAASAAMLAEMSADPARVTEIGKVATQWLGLDAAKRGEDQGVLLAGTVEDLGEAGNLHRTRVRLTEGGSPVSVYSIAPPEVAAGDTVVMLGSIVVSPKEAIQDFAGDEATIVWLGTAVKASGK